MKNQIISYGIGRDYLPKWGIKEALREIFQNFIDFGVYNFNHSLIMDTNDEKVCLFNSYTPNELEFLRIGMSDKEGNKESIGKHGEGLKMALLIFLRKNLFIKVITQKYEVEPIFINSDEIGEIYALKYTKHNQYIKNFIIEFDCPSDILHKFKDDIIKEEDTIFKLEHHGELVSKPKGNIYSGSLFICNLPNFSGAYNILPSNIPLDRDRAVPRQFDVNWHTSKIQEAYGKWSAIDNTYNDTEYISNVPNTHKQSIKPIAVGNSIEFVAKDENGNDIVIKNRSIKEALSNDSFFEIAIRKIKLFLIKSLGLYDLLIQFQEKHVHTLEAKRDFELILEQVKNGTNNYGITTSKNSR